MKKDLPSIKLGLIELRVRDLTQAASFYRALIGLQEIGRTKRVLVLGWNGTPLLRFHEDPTALPAAPSEAGLYHLALVFSSQAHLATVLARLLKSAPQLFQGSSDHLVTEAFYFVDPEGNGVELYYDRPRELWPTSNGSLVMGSESLDSEQFIRRHFNPEAVGEVAVGHIHLKVGNIAGASEFYGDALGFTTMLSMPTARFFAYEGYHHHIGINTWESAGALVRNNKSLGLISVTILMRRDVYAEVCKRMKSDESKGEQILTDPWGTVVILVNLG